MFPCGAAEALAGILAADRVTFVMQARQWYATPADVVDELIAAAELTPAWRFSSRPPGGRHRRGRGRAGLRRGLRGARPRPRQRLAGRRHGPHGDLRRLPGLPAGRLV